MKVLICGTGKITREILKRLGQNWQISIIEKSEEILKDLTNFYPFIERTVHGDASSPVVLSEADAAAHDYILAMTNSDPVNLAICRFAIENGIKHVFARVHNPEQQKEFKALGVKTVMVNTMIARTIYHYLQDPRIVVTPMADGRGEILEIEITSQMGIIGKRVATISGAKWRPAALMRDGDLLFPNAVTTLQEGDRLVILGKFDGFESICNILNFQELDFPLAYGRELLLAMPPKKNLDEDKLMSESFHFAQNTCLRRITVLSSATNGNLKQRFEEISQGIDIRFESTEDNFLKRIKECSVQENIGIAVIPPFDASFLKSITKSQTIDLAHELPCPLLVARNCWPFERILVPFNATARAEKALETAINLARQINSQITAVTVKAPDFIHGDNGEEWAQKASRKVQKLAHINKIKIEEVLREGNPVKEVVELSRNFDLVILGSTTKEGSLLSPHVGEHLARKAFCSVLVIAS